MKTIYADTNALVYAYRDNLPKWIKFFEDYFSGGYRLVLVEEQIFEISQWHNVRSNVSVVSHLMSLQPLWARSFADVQADEMMNFLKKSSGVVNAFRVEHDWGVDPVEIVKALGPNNPENSPREYWEEHRLVLDELTEAQSTGALTKEMRDYAFKVAVKERLSRKIPAEELSGFLEYCIKNRKQLMRSCPSFAVEEHISDYRCSNPSRKAKISDSVDLIGSISVLPYVDVFVTNDGYLHGGISHVKAKMSNLSSSLLRGPK